ncbi:hypothetical protein J7E91_08715 [Streptomyces sp. ISL-99]|uniref:hypothetical protein n=1 Tax=Streptomyces sp. ISL-99 TaxID=2819193 RepID=UPI001BEA9D27|nr:hypothetical protein [Streptomyces sp. ISL-99]MBT2525515.1 hypothetical protein [Streptomyces sp. ISL-99]
MTARTTTLERDDARYLAAYRAVLDHADICPNCHTLRCPVGARLRRAAREARR